MASLRISAAAAILACHYPLQALGLMTHEAMLAGMNASADSSVWPWIVPLLREAVPVIRNNVTISHKTSYSGVVSIGRPVQEFRVVFDTGSGHVVVPSKDCTSATCFEHRRYDLHASETSLAINGDGAPVPADELCDQVTIGYGTGKVKGEFSRDLVCPGEGSLVGGRPCIETSVIMAVEMSDSPFKSFNFDGIFGLALDKLAMTPEFSFPTRLGASFPQASQQFAVFLTEEDGQSEIALGGYNTKRLLSPLLWAPVAMEDLGYWQVAIKEVRVNGKPLPICEDGTCRGIVDTGTSHIGVPGPQLRDFVDHLSVDVSEPLLDCRKAAGPALEYVLDASLSLSLSPTDYMRPLSLEIGTNVGMSDGKPVLAGIRGAAGGANQTDGSVMTADANGNVNKLRTCTPRVMPVNLPAPLGPKLFIMGEPLLQKYYTVYDWKEKKIGFALSSGRGNRKALGLDQVPQDHASLMQVTIKVTTRVARRC